MHQPSPAALLSCLVVWIACAPPPPAYAPSRCDPVALDRPRTFAWCDVGSGVFGRWGLDAYGLPAYLYTGDATDPRAQWTLSDGSVRTDHLFQIGNDRVIGVVDTGGFVQLFVKDRGPLFANKLNLDDGRFGGGFSWIARDTPLGAEVWATAPALAPPDARSTRTFGIQSATVTTDFDGVSVTHHVIAPNGDGAYLIDEVTIANITTHEQRLRHYEAWDVNRQWLALQLLRSGTLSSSLPSQADADRAQANGAFDIDAVVEVAPRALVRIRQRNPNTLQQAADATSQDAFAMDTFLVRLHDQPGRFYVDRASFIGAGSLRAPGAVVAFDAPRPLAPQNARAQPALLVDEVPLLLAPHAHAVLRYAYGLVTQDQPIAIDAAWDHAGPAAVDADASAQAAALPRLVVSSAPQLQREMAWHAAQLLGATAYDGSFAAHHTTQGSAYQYLHGLDGAARDYALSTIPLVYLRPDLAKENLRMIMRMTYAEGGQISYATAGFGKAEDAIIHTNPSDLDLFFLWALSEYVVATGDRDFLRDDEPFYPRSSAVHASVLDHARIAVDHLLRDDGVGTGPHGLLRLRTGDWSDGIAFQAANRALVLRDGESIPNTQMATWVLPLAASALFDDDTATRDTLLSAADALAAALPAQWLAAGWYRRAWLGGQQTAGDVDIDLEAQVWGLIANTPTATQLSDAVFTRLDAPSSVGAPLFRGGDVWPAVSQLLTWGYTRVSPARAWRSFVTNTRAAYATENPTQWYGIWSAPDGIGPHGGTWTSKATPMTDWPVMNSNAHAMPLLAMLRVAGIEPVASGELRIGAASIPEAFVLDTPLVLLQRDIDGALHITLRCVAAGLVRVAVAAQAHGAEVDGVVTAAAPDGDVHAQLLCTPGATHTLDVR